MKKEKSTLYATVSYNTFMNIEFRQINTQKEEMLYDRFIESSPYGSFFQTRAWGAFQNHISGRTFLGCFGVFEGRKIVGGMIVIRHALPFDFSWLYTPRGPVIAWDHPAAEEIFALCATEIKKCARAQKAIFWRTDPMVPKDYPQAATVEKTLKNHNTRPAHTSFQPEWTRIVDLTQTEDDILKQMKPKGRYNIRLAAKKGVIVQESKDTAFFTKMMRETGDRDGFSVHVESTYDALLKNLTENPAARLFMAYAPDQKTPLAAALVIFYGKTATYLYGASVSQNRELMAPYALHWEIMRYAKSHNCEKYDFFGISPPGKQNHPWQGVSEFKEKFGGFAVHYLESQELVFQKVLYVFYGLAKALRKYLT